MVVNHINQFTLLCSLSCLCRFLLVRDVQWHRNHSDISCHQVWRKVCLLLFRIHANDFLANLGRIETANSLALISARKTTSKTIRVSLELYSSCELLVSYLSEILRLFEAVRSISKIEDELLAVIHSFIKFFKCNFQVFAFITNILWWNSLHMNVISFITLFVYEDVEVWLLTKSNKLVREWASPTSPSNASKSR